MVSLRYWSTKGKVYGGHMVDKRTFYPPYDLVTRCSADHHLISTIWPPYTLPLVDQYLKETITCYIHHMTSIPFHHFYLPNGDWHYLSGWPFLMVQIQSITSMIHWVCIPFLQKIHVSESMWCQNVYSAYQLSLLVVRDKTLTRALSPCKNLFCVTKDCRYN